MLPYLACASPQVDNHLILASPCRDGQFNEMTLNNMRGQTRSCSIFPLCSAFSFHLPYCPIPFRCFHSLCPKHGLFFCQGFDTSKLQREGRLYEKKEEVFLPTRGSIASVFASILSSGGFHRWPAHHPPHTQVLLRSSRPD